MSEPNRACPLCREHGHDSKGDHLFLMADGKRWCCNRTEHHPDHIMYFEDADSGEQISNEERVQGEVFHNKVLEKDVDPMTFPVLGHRGIPRRIYGNAGVRCETNKDGNPVAFYFPTNAHDGTMLWKIRKLPKKFFTSEEVEDRKLEFFNQSNVGVPKRLLITEGHEDCLAATWMLEKYKIKVVSVPNGANIKAFEDNYDFLSRIEELYLDLDNDKAGDKLLPKVVALFPKIRILQHTEKDACDVLKLKGAEEVYQKAFWEAKPYKPESIVEINDELIEMATKPVEWGLSYPFKQLTRRTFGMVTKQVIGIAAGPGAGKTTFAQALQSHILFQHNLPIGLLDFENSADFAFRKLIGFHLGLKIHTPDTPYPPHMQKKARAMAKTLRDKGLTLYRPRKEQTWEDITNVIRYMVVTRGIKYIFIDPMSGLVTGLDSSEGNTYLNNAMFELSNLTRDLDFTVFHINHLNNPKTGKDHGEGAQVKGSQFSGSRAMWKFSTDLWGLEVNQQAEDEAERSKVTVRIIKHRLDGNTGTFPLRYNKETGKHEEPTSIDIMGGPADERDHGEGNNQCNNEPPEIPGDGESYEGVDPGSCEVGQEQPDIQSGSASFEQQDQRDLDADGLLRVGGEGVGHDFGVGQVSDEQETDDRGREVGGLGHVQVGNGDSGSDAEVHGLAEAGQVRHNVRSEALVWFKLLYSHPGIVSGRSLLKRAQNVVAEFKAEQKGTDPGGQSAPEGEARKTPGNDTPHHTREGEGLVSGEEATPSTPKRRRRTVSKRRPLSEVLGNTVSSGSKPQDTGPPEKQGQPQDTSSDEGSKNVDHRQTTPDRRDTGQSSAGKSGDGKTTTSLFSSDNRRKKRALPRGWVAQKSDQTPPGSGEYAGGRERPIQKTTGEREKAEERGSGGSPKTTQPEGVLQGKVREEPEKHPETPEPDRRFDNAAGSNLVEEVSLSEEVDGFQQQKRTASSLFSKKK